LLRDFSTDLCYINRNGIPRIEKEFKPSTLLNGKTDKERFIIEEEADRSEK
jgi:hypothetical protein